MIRSDITAARATTHTDRQRALTVLDASYTEEKHWVESAAKLFPEDDLRDERITWVVATVDDSPAGVLRVDFDPPLDHYRDYDPIPLDGVGDLDVDAFVQRHRIAQIGPFAVLPAFRLRFRIVFWLMRAAGVETLQRGYSHYVTDIFENEEHSPYRFHTRVLGFRPAATHESGERDCLHRRITLVLNLKEAYQRLRDSQNRLYRFLTDGLDVRMQRQLST